MTPTKLLIGQILIVFTIMALGVWAATQGAAAQGAAAMLGYQTEPGEPWFIAAHSPVYRPWSLVYW
jgi:type IV secretion system protein VirD4